MKPTPKKPFGLTVASKIAAKAIHENVAPASIVLCNMFYLQKTSNFPKDLDTQFFSISKYNPNSAEKKAIVYLLDEFKKPKTDVATLLESVFEEGWVKKIPPKPVMTAPVAKKVTRTKVFKPVGTTPATPVVVIKKPKMGA